MSMYSRLLGSASSARPYMNTAPVSQPLQADSLKEEKPKLSKKKRSQRPYLEFKI